MMSHMEHESNSTTNGESSGMSMPTIFNTNAQITLFFTGWTTSSLTQYIFSLLFLFLLAVFNRFLGALKFQLEKTWNENALILPRYSLHSMHKEQQFIPKARLASEYMQVGRGETSEEESFPIAYDGEEKPLPATGYFYYWPFSSWKASGPWSLCQDGTRALLEFVRASIGYILMLAVMTFNVGIFFAVLGGILIGELVLGRFSQGMSDWQEGACHNG